MIIALANINLAPHFIKTYNRNLALKSQQKKAVTISIPIQYDKVRNRQAERDKKICIV
jgi:hypothetical protein